MMDEARQLREALEYLAALAEVEAFFDQECTEADFLMWELELAAFGEDS